MTAMKKLSVQELWIHKTVNRLFLCQNPDCLLVGSRLFGGKRNSRGKMLKYHRHLTFHPRTQLLHRGNKSAYKNG